MADEQLFGNVIKDLNTAKKSGALYVSVVETSEDLIRIYFERGEIYYMKYGTAVGMDCLDILDYYNLYSATFFEGIKSPAGVDKNLPPTEQIITKLDRLNKKVKVK